MKKIDRIFLALLLAVFLIALLDGSGAAGSAGDENKEGRLIGFIATREHLDLDELKVSATGKFTWETGRLYAEKTGRGWYFPGVEGDGIFCVSESAREDALLPDDTPTVIYYGDIQPESHVYLDGEAMSVTMNGELCVMVGEHITFFCNPVYQLPDGRVYLTAGQGIASDAWYAGERMTTTLRSEVSTTMNGRRTQYSCEAKFTIATLAVPEKFLVTHMSEDDAVLAVESFAPDALPEAIVPVDGAAYVIGEMCSIDGDGTRLTDYVIDSRGALSSEHPAHTLTANAVADGALVRTHIPVDWKEADEG